MQDGTPWPGDNARDHPGIIQVLLGQSGGKGNDGKDLPCLIYVSREKRPGFDHHKKAGAMNALVSQLIRMGQKFHCLGKNLYSFILLLFSNFYFTAVIALNLLRA